MRYYHISEHQRYQYVRWAEEPDVSGQPETDNWATAICGNTARPLLRGH